MSRIGKQPITIPSGVEISVKSGEVSVKGPKGELFAPLFKGIEVTQKDSILRVSCANLGDKRTKSFYGLVRALLANHIHGVSTGFERVLELRGVGYRAQAQGQKLNLSLGFSHPVEYIVPDGVKVNVDQSRIMISGIDKQQVGQVAAEIRAWRPPEPYKGKGVRYLNERVIMKEGKKA